jgi:hypothetical protein
MDINPAQLQVFFFGLLVFFVVLRLAAFNMTRQKSLNDAERITRLEQKVDAIMRRLDMNENNARFGATANDSTSPWSGAPATSTRTGLAMRDDVRDAPRAGPNVAEDTRDEAERSF